MPRPRKNTPSYLRHPNGQGRIAWTDAAGQRRFKLLPGPFNSPESLAAFHRLTLGIATSPITDFALPPAGLTVAEVLLSYIQHATGYYGDGSELRCVKYALKVVREVYGVTPAGALGPVALKAVREAMVRKGWSRPYCNAQIRRVVRAFKWAAGEELVPATVHTALKTLAPLRAGKTDAPETDPRQPADVAVVERTIPFLPPHTRRLVELLRLTGMRPSEVCRRRWARSIASATSGCTRP